VNIGARPAISEMLTAVTRLRLTVKNTDFTTTPIKAAGTTIDIRGIFCLRCPGRTAAIIRQIAIPLILAAESGIGRTFSTLILVATMLTLSPRGQRPSLDEWTAPVTDFEEAGISLSLFEQLYLAPRHRAQRPARNRSSAQAPD
jgi:hypothetical protein